MDLASSSSHCILGPQVLSDSIPVIKKYSLIAAVKGPLLWRALMSFFVLPHIYVC